MKCERCEQEFEIKLASKVQSKNCKILNSMTTILTVRCSNCNHAFQIPVQNKKIMSMKEE